MSRNLRGITNISTCCWRGAELDHWDDCMAARPSLFSEYRPRWTAASSREVKNPDLAAVVAPRLSAWTHPIITIWNTVPVVIFSGIKGAHVIKPKGAITPIQMWLFRRKSPWNHEKDVSDGQKMFDPWLQATGTVKSNNKIYRYRVPICNNLWKKDSLVSLLMKTQLIQVPVLGRISGHNDNRIYTPYHMRNQAENRI